MRMIRPATSADLPRLLELEVASFGEEAWPAEFLAAELAGPSRRYFVAETGLRSQAGVDAWSGLAAESEPVDRAGADPEVAGGTESASGSETGAGFVDHADSGAAVGTGVGLTVQVVGYAGVFIGWPESEVMSLAVDPAARGRGIGRALMEALLNAAADGGSRRIRLTVAEGSKPALKLYRSLGFEFARRVRGYYQPSGRDGLVLRRML
jgi:ribosomal protein S18 acetylase RimI-like enzyme